MIPWRVMQYDAKTSAFLCVSLLCALCVKKHLIPIQTHLISLKDTIISCPYKTNSLLDAKLLQLPTVPLQFLDASDVRNPLKKLPVARISVADFVVSVSEAVASPRALLLSIFVRVHPNPNFCKITRSWLQLFNTLILTFKTSCHIFIAQ